MLLKYVREDAPLGLLPVTARERWFFVEATEKVSLLKQRPMFRQRIGTRQVLLLA